MDYYKLGQVAGKAWRLGHMGASLEEKIAAVRDSSLSLQVPEGERTNHYRGFDAGVLAVDENAAQVHPPEPFNAEAQAPGGDRVSLWIDPESEHRYVVGLHTHTLYIAWATENEQQARSLFDALQRARVLEAD